MTDKTGRAEPPRFAPPTGVPSEGSADADLSSLGVHDAGLVLTWPYLSTLWTRLGIAPSKDPAAASVAEAVLGYVLSGQRHGLVSRPGIARVLIGLPPAALAPALKGAPMPDVSDDSARTVDEMLAALLADWPELEYVSLDSFRESFLSRPGRLDVGEEALTLTVERAAYDVLLSRYPAQIISIKTDEMPKLLTVNWLNN